MEMIMGREVGLRKGNDGLQVTMMMLAELLWGNPFITICNFTDNQIIISSNWKF